MISGGGGDRLEWAVERIRECPMRWCRRDSGTCAEDVLERGWFCGASECARVLAGEAAVPVVEGAGFGGSWPILDGGDRVIAPGMPVAVGEGATVAVDGEYTLRAGSVWREAGGSERLFLTTAPADRALGEPFDLVWFGDGERFTLRAATLEVEDLFGTLRVPAGLALMERVLIRPRRVERSILPPLPALANRQPSTIEVRRAAALADGDTWRDAVGYLVARVDVDRVRRVGSHVEAGTVSGETVEFTLDETDAGWTLTRQVGSSAFAEISVQREDADTVVRVALDEAVDALAPGMRQRLIFDLRTDLVALD